MARLDLQIIEVLYVFLLFISDLEVCSYSQKRRILEPIFLNTPRNITVHMNEVAILQCRIKHLGPKRVAWRKVAIDYPLTVGKTTFDQREDLSVNYKDLKDQEKGLSQWDLIIKQAKPRHSGMYECQISSKKVYTHYVYLKVLDTPLHKEPEIKLTGSEFVNLHESIELVCSASGAGNVRIDWFFKGHKIRQGDFIWGSRLNISYTVPDVPRNALVSKLTVMKSTFSDKGKYVCRSVIGDISRTTSMDVTVLNKKVHDKREENTNVAPLPTKGTNSARCIIISTTDFFFVVFIAIFYSA